MIWYVCISTIHKCMCGPCILEAFLQSTCRREMPSSTGSYQSVINKDSSEASSSSRVPSSKKAVIISCPMSQRFLITTERSSSLILLLSLLYYYYPVVRTDDTCSSVHNCNVYSTWTNCEALQRPCWFTVPTAVPPRGPEGHVNPRNVISELKGFKLIGIQGFRAGN